MQLTDRPHVTSAGLQNMNPGGVVSEHLSIGIGVLGLDARQRELQSQAGDFHRALAASIQHTMEQHHLDYVPASAELADFDPTSTSIAISPLNLTPLFPAAALRKTYDLYFEHLAKPRDDYTPYEMRTIGALIRLGDRDRALQLVDRFLRDRRPAPWNGGPSSWVLPSRRWWPPPRAAAADAMNAPTSRARNM